MPLMTKIRDNLTKAFSVFAGLFVVYIVLDWGMDITQRRSRGQRAEAQEVGSINGDPILFRDFSEIVRRQVENQKNQTGVDPDEDQQRAIRDQVWNYLIEQRLFEDEIKHLGIKVNDQEIVDWARSDSPPELLRRQFIDSTGNFNRQAYESAILDPRNKAAMIAAETELRRQRAMTKLQSLVQASVRVSEADILQKFVDQNIKYEADYVLLDPSVLVKDDEIKVTDDDLQRFYREHSDEFKVEATRKLKYVLFSETASKKDSEDVARDMEDILRRAKEGADFQELAKTYNETPSADTIFHKHGEIGSEREADIFAAKAGDIFGPKQEADGYHIVKVHEFRPGKEEFVRASHILIKIENNDSVKALKETKDLLARVKRGDDFAELAKTHSKDPGSGARGGDLGWFGKGRMVKPFEEAAFKSKPGQIVGPVHSDFGYHIIKVVARDDREVRYTDIHMSVRVSQQTKNDAAQRAQDFGYLAKQGDFAKEAELSKYRVLETPPFQKDAAIPGVGMNPAVGKFAFNGKLGDVSEALSLQNGYAVFKISEIKEAGIRPFEELKASLESRVKREMKMEKLKTLANELHQMLSPGDSLGKITTKRSDLSAQHLAPFTLSGFIPGIGRDLAFMGAVSSLKPGVISKPFEGQRGYYLIGLTSATPFDSAAFKLQKESLRNQLLTEKRNRFFGEWSDQLKKSANIVDNRDLFYRF